MAQNPIKHTPIDGGEIMLFVFDSATRKYRSLAMAKSHSLSLSSNTDSLSHKDLQSVEAKTVKNITWEISSEHFYSTDTELIMEKMLAKEKLQVVFTSKLQDNSKLVAEQNDLEHWSPKANGWKGEVFITSYQVTATNWELSQVSITLSGASALTKATGLQ